MKKNPSRMPLQRRSNAKNTDARNNSKDEKDYNDDYNHQQQEHQHDKKRMLVIIIALGFLHVLFVVLKSSLSLFSLRYSNNRCSVLGRLSKEELSEIKKLDLKDCNLSEVPSTIGHLTNLVQLDISNNPLLSDLPDEIRRCHRLDTFFSSSNPGMTTLPTILGEMTSITRLGWRSGSLTEIDADSIPPNVIHFILTDNQIQTIDDPNVFTRLRHVRKLMLSHNRISSFGGGASNHDNNNNDNNNTGITQLQNLELLRLGGNQLTYIHPQLWELPKLTWLTLSGNPIVDEWQKNRQQEEDPVVSAMKSRPLEVNINDLTPIGIALGQGASGKVSTYIWKDEQQQQQQVAVKLIRGVTSDGTAKDELSVYAQVMGPEAMKHRVVGCLALLEDQKGIIMERLPQGLTDLAQPPTILEVTNDRWGEEEEGGPPRTRNSTFVMNALKDVQTALSYLHKIVGVAHGDVYAHNMKVDPESGRVYLLDFGASYFPGDHAIQAERLEVRAFGVLIGELVSQIMMIDSNEEKIMRDKLLLLRDKCMDTNVRKRILLREIEDYLDQI